MALGSLARASARCPGIVISIWAVVFIAAIGVVGWLWDGSFTSEGVLFGESEYNAGERILEERFRGPRPATEIVLVHSDTYTIVDPEFEATVQNLFFDVAALAPGVVSGVSQYYNSGSDWQVSDDGHSTIIPVTMSGTLDEASANVSELMSVVRSYNGQDDFEVLLVGEASVAERIAASVTRLYLITQTIGFGNAVYYIVFIGLIGMGTPVGLRLPVLLSMPMVATPAAVAALIGVSFPIHALAINVLFLIAPIVGLVFPIFIALRYREERLQGNDNLDAIQRACSTVGTAIALGALTAIVGLVGLLIVPASGLISLGLGAILALVVPLVGAVTLTPALITLRYDRVVSSRSAESDSPEEADVGPPTGRGRASRMLDRVVGLAVDRPVPSALLVIAILLALSVPILDLRLGFNSSETMPNRHDRREAYGPQHFQAFTKLSERFPAGVMSPLEIVIDAPFADPNVESFVAELQAAVTFNHDFAPQAIVQTNLDRDVVLMSVPSVSHPESEAAIEAVRRLREDLIPEVLGESQFDVLVTGRSAFAADLLDIVEGYAPVVLIVTLVSSFIILLVAARSVVVPVILTVMNVLSVGAALAVVVLIFQNDAGTSGRPLVIEAWLPMLIAPLLVGFLTVTHLILLGRIRERYGQTGEHTSSIASGMSATVGRVVLLALVMAAIFGNLVFELFGSRLFPFHQFGVAMAVGLVLNTVLVQLVLLPAALRLLGDSAWYFPRLLEWLPDFSVVPGSLKR